jgi:hypothetical protein
MNEKILHKRNSMVLIICKIVSIAFVLTTLICIANTIMAVIAWDAEVAKQAHSNGLTIYPNTAGVGIEKFRICIALIIASILTIAWRLPKSLIAIPLTWILFEYILWCYSSFSSSWASEQSAEIKEKTFQYLIGSTWWDYWVLLMVIASLVFLFIKNRASISKEMVIE